MSNASRVGLVSYAFREDFFERYTSYAFVETLSDGTEREILQIHVAEDNVVTVVLEDEPFFRIGTHDEIDFLTRLS